jgi:hypothetical protein
VAHFNLFCIPLDSSSQQQGSGQRERLSPSSSCTEAVSSALWWQVFFSFSFVFISVNAKHACGGGEVTNFDVVSVVCFCGSGVFFGSYCSD